MLDPAHLSEHAALAERNCFSKPPEAPTPPAMVPRKGSHLEKVFIAGKCNEPLAGLAECRAIIAPAIANRFEVGVEAPHQPGH